MTKIDKYKRNLARYEAYLEASEHLTLDWTEDKLEFQEGLKISLLLLKQANKWLAKSSD